MPKNKGKGGKTRKRGKNNSEQTRKDVLLREEGQEYGVVVRMLGNGRLEALCYDGKKRLCHIRGKMKKKIWIAQGDTVLISLRDFQDDKADVIHKYKPEEARELKKMGELPVDAKINESSGFDDDSKGKVSIEFLEDGNNIVSGNGEQDEEEEEEEEEETESEEETDSDEEIEVAPKNAKVTFDDL
eukprot:gene4422-7797_t